MTAFFQLIANFFWSIWHLLDNVFLSYGNISVSYASILLCAIIIGFVVNIFWKGAKA